MSVARTPDGTDAFVVIAARLASLQRPVDAVMALGKRLPCAREFADFAALVALADAAYQAYLRADLRDAEAKHLQAQREATNAEG